MIASNNASSSLNEVSIRHRKSGISERRSRQTSIPVAVGQADVEHGDVGRRCRNALSASAAVPASPTTSRSSALSNSLSGGCHPPSRPLRLIKARDGARSTGSRVRPCPRARGSHARIDR